MTIPAPTPRRGPAQFNLRWENGTELFEYVCQQANYATELMVGDKTSVDRTTRSFRRRRSFSGHRNIALFTCIDSNASRAGPRLGDAKRRLELSPSLLDLPLLEQHPEIRAGHRIVRILIDQPRQLARRLIHLSLPRERGGHIQPGIAVHRIARERFLVFSNRLAGPVGDRQQQPEVVVRLRIIDPGNRRRRYDSAS